VAVIGGLRRPLGAFIGAFIYVILQVFSPDVLGAFGFSSERFKLIIGVGFLVVVLFSPDGVLGLWDRWRARQARRGDPLTGAPR
jgi:branched-chain amino acid transport system permease protein